jgi:hypothetical protein
LTSTDLNCFLWLQFRLVMLKQESGGHSDCRIAVIPIAVILQSPSQGKWPSVSLPLPGVKKTIDIDTIDVDADEK